MRVLHLNKAYPPVIGGVEKVVQDIAEALKCDVLCCNDKMSAETVEYEGFTVFKAAPLLDADFVPFRLAAFPVAP